MLESNFFTKFLQLSDFRTLAFIVALIALFKVINVLQKKKVSFSTVLGLVLGVIVQAVAKFPDSPKDIAWISELSGWYGFVGGGFIDLLKMLVIPLILLSITRVIMNMKGDNLGKLTTKTIGSSFLYLNR